MLGLGGRVGWGCRGMEKGGWAASLSLSLFSRCYFGKYPGTSLGMGAPPKSTVWVSHCCLRRAGTQRPGPLLLGEPADCDHVRAVECHSTTYRSFIVQGWMLSLELRFALKKKFKKISPDLLRPEHVILGTDDGGASQPQGVRGPSPQT